MMLRFGIFSVVDHYPGELPRTTAQLYDELLEQAQAAEAWGFDSFWIAEHHFHEYGGIRLYARQRPLDLLVEKDLVAFGSAADVTRVARRYAEAGLTHFLAIPNFGGLEHKKVLRSMERLAKEVMPAFRA